MCGLFAGSYSILFILLSYSLSRLKVIQVLLFLIVTNNFIYQHFLYFDSVLVPTSRSRTIVVLTDEATESAFLYTQLGLYAVHSYSVMLGKTLYIHRTLYGPIAAPKHCETFYYQ